ncbi:uncharacterized protein A4U43_C06F10200 [Asparagus officinalis]|uniref:Uncharacterized protein n=1 Tax=Asparagus officinalis TaxID=4686 RepID=A0A5P1EL41_ASPOF|nr:uncharacterized protein A4U43_C06F10200 [Asparagus officinalis]
MEKEVNLFYFRARGGDCRRSADGSGHIAAGWPGERRSRGRRAASRWAELAQTAAIRGDDGGRGAAGGVGLTHGRGPSPGGRRRSERQRAADQPGRSSDAGDRAGLRAARVAATGAGAPRDASAAGRRKAANGATTATFFFTPEQLRRRTGAEGQQQRGRRPPSTATSRCGAARPQPDGRCGGCGDELGYLFVAKGDLQQASGFFKIVFDEDPDNIPALLGQIRIILEVCLCFHELKLHEFYGDVEWGLPFGKSM